MCGHEALQEIARQQGIQQFAQNKAREIVCRMAPLGLPAAQIAEIAGVSAETVRKWLSGQKA